MKRLNYHHLFYFWQVAQIGNLTQAAETLHVSQSALSAQIKQLESMTNTALFERSGRKLVLTNEGRQVLRFANEIFRTGEELENWLSTGRHSDQNLLRIGLQNNLSRNFTDDYLKPVLQDSAVSLSLITRDLEDLLNGLVQHQLDLVLSNRPLPDTDQNLFHSQLISRQAVSIVGPSDQHFNGTFPSSYSATQWVLPNRTSEIRIAFDAICASQGFNPIVRAEAEDMAMLRLLARDTGALSVLPDVVVKDEINQGVLKVYQSLPSIHENFYAIFSRKNLYPDALTRLLQSHPLH